MRIVFCIFMTLFVSCGIEKYGDHRPIVLKAPQESPRALKLSKNEEDLFSLVDEKRCETLQRLLKDYHQSYLRGTELTIGDCLKKDENSISIQFEIQRQTATLSFELHDQLNIQIDAKTGLQSKHHNLELYKRNEAHELTKWNPQKENLLIHSNLSHLLPTLQKVFQKDLVVETSLSCEEKGRDFNQKNSECIYPSPKVLELDHPSFAKLKTQEERTTFFSNILQEFAQKYLPGVQIQNEDIEYAPFPTNEPESKTPPTKPNPLSVFVMSASYIFEKTFLGKTQVLELRIDVLLVFKTQKDDVELISTQVRILAPKTPWTPETIKTQSILHPNLVHLEKTIEHAFGKNREDRRGRK